MSSDLTVEVRFDCPKEIVDIFDAISFANKEKSHNPEMIRALKAYAEHQRHVAMMINRVAGVYPADRDVSGT
jgi:hypothetical protein